MHEDGRVTGSSQQVTRIFSAPFRDQFLLIESIMIVTLLFQNIATTPQKWTD